MKVTRKGSITEIDLHGLRVEDAQARLLHLIEQSPPQVKEIHVIHGYTRGTVLKDAVRALKHRRIQCILPSLNEGMSRIFLK